MRRVLFAGVAASLGCGQLLGVDELRDRDSSDASVEATADASPDVDVCPAPDGGCATFEQCPCSSDQNCIVYGASFATMCVAAGSTDAWNKCSYSTACKKGMECIGWACKPFCRDASDCVGANVTCEQIKNPPDIGQDIPGLRVCSSGCDPTNPNAICGAGVTCGPYPWDGTGNDHGDCFGNSQGATGPNTCVGQAAACAPGWVCVDAKDCDPWCRVKDDGGCPLATTCHSFAPAQVPVIGGVEYGYCN